MNNEALESLIENVQQIIDDYRENYTFDIAGFLKIVYETYRYFKRKETPRKIEPYELNLIKYFALLAGF